MNRKYSINIFLFVFFFIPLSCSDLNQSDGFNLSQSEIDLIIERLGLHSNSIHIITNGVLNDSSVTLQVIETVQKGIKELDLRQVIHLDSCRIFLYGDAFNKRNVPERWISKSEYNIHTFPWLESTNILVQKRNLKLDIGLIEFLPPGNLKKISVPDGN